MWKKFEKFLDNNTLFVYIAKCVSIASAIMTVLFAVFAVVLACVHSVWWLLAVPSCGILCGGVIGFLFWLAEEF